MSLLPKIEPLAQEALSAAADDGLRESLRLLDLPAPWIVVLLILPLFGFVTWIGYGRESIGLRAEAVVDPGDALKMALQTAGSKRWVLITGSLHLVGRLRSSVMFEGREAR